jgi:prepilin-type N-terminal cleavage/methylation domain-containing protein/prepilin-type processing-associated H-X9-DG protein
MTIWGEGFDRASWRVDFLGRAQGQNHPPHLRLGVQPTACRPSVRTRKGVRRGRRTYTVSALRNNDLKLVAMGRETHYTFLVPRTKVRIVRKAFTLIELLVVVVIIAVLTTLLLPALGEARRQSGRNVCGANLRNIGMAFDMYRGEYSDVYPCKNDSGSVWLWMGRGWRPVLEPYIAPGLSAKNPNVLWCPQDGSPENRYENTSYAYTMSFYHSPEQINGITDKSGTYSNPQPGVAIIGTRVTFPAKKILIGEWFANHRLVTGDYATEPGWWKWLGTRNFLLADGHVEFVAAQKIKPANDGLPDPNLTHDGVDGSDL